MSEQIQFALDNSLWIQTRDGDNTVRSVFDRHYSRRKFKPGRSARLFVGPGGKLVLRTPDCRAIFVWRKFISMDNQRGVNCAVFRNEGSTRSSDLIRAAMEIAWERWPRERLYTYVDATQIKSANPGCCFKMAGWRKCGETKHGLHILEVEP